MDKSLELTLTSYFNVYLKKSLNYSDTFLPPIYEPKGNIIFFKNSNGIFQLGNILRGSPDLTSQLKDILVSFLRKYYGDNLFYVKLKFDGNGFGIIFIMKEEVPDISRQNIDTYFNIIQHLDTVEDIDQFCRSSTITNEACKLEELWRKLITAIYPFKYSRRYNYEKLYKEYVTYKTHDIQDEDGMYPYVKNLNEFESMWYFIRFLFDEGIIKLDERSIYETYLQPIIYMRDKQLFDDAVEHFKSIDIDPYYLQYTISGDFSIAEIINTQDFKRLINLVDFTKGLIYKDVDLGYLISKDILYDLEILIKDKDPIIKKLRSNENFKEAVKHLMFALGNLIDHSDYLIAESVELGLNIRY